MLPNDGYWLNDATINSQSGHFIGPKISALGLRWHQLIRWQNWSCFLKPAFQFALGMLP